MSNISRLQGLFPQLNISRQKGDNGKLGVFGGCMQYTGGTYYTGMSMLVGGSDLSHIFCTKLAGTPIKSYCPEIIVHPCLNARDETKEKYWGQKEKLLAESLKYFEAIQKQSFHGFVVGPGLGRDEWIQELIPQIVSKIRPEQILVLDADALWLLSRKQHNFLEIVRSRSGYTILTPHQREFETLATSLLPKDLLLSSISQPERLQILENLKQSHPDTDYVEIDPQDKLVELDLALSRHLNNALIVHKGFVDIITDGQKCFAVLTDSSQKRCGGQGDIVSGLSCLYSHWQRQSQSQNTYTPLDALILATYLVRKSSFSAFQKYTYSLTAPKIIDFLTPAIQNFLTQTKL